MQNSDEITFKLLSEATLEKDDVRSQDSVNYANPNANPNDIDGNDQSHENPPIPLNPVENSVNAVAQADYHVLKDQSEKERLTKTANDILYRLGITEQELIEQNISLKTVNAFLSREMSCHHYLRWATVDSLVEKIFQDLLISKEDLKLESAKCSAVLQHLSRFLPHGRSILLQQEWGIKKVYAARGFVRTTEEVATWAVQLFIATALSYRLVELIRTGSSEFSEFTGVFQSNSNRGVRSLVQLLAKVDKRWLQLLIASPFIIGGLKGLWNSLWTQRPSENTFATIQAIVAEHSIKHSFSTLLWRDGLRQLIVIPGYDSVSQYAQKAERLIRWDGRITSKERNSFFQQIEKLALQGRSWTKIVAMQSLAKIVHSLSIKDFKALQMAGHSNEALLQILKIKAEALYTMNYLASESRYSKLTRLYANYLLWWLGIGTLKRHIAFGLYKGTKITLQILFLKAIIESVFEAIDCPDKPGFRMFYGDYEIWANDLTPECFTEFVRQFRLISKVEPIQPFLEQLQNFHLEEVSSIDFTDKALTSNETRIILQVLNPKMTMKYLNLSSNNIDETDGLIFSDKLLYLNLGFNRIGPANAQRLKLPQSLQQLWLSSNLIGDMGAQGLNFSFNLQKLDLSRNQIGDTGAEGLRFPPNLQWLDLSGNQIGIVGALGLKFPPNLLELKLVSNQISDTAAQGIKFPLNLQSLDLSNNQIGAKGAQGLNLPANLQKLDLGFNQIGDAGTQGLKFPQNLLSLSLRRNQIGDAGAQRLNFSSNLQQLDLGWNQIGDAGAQALRFPPNLQTLELSINLIGDAGASGLNLPSKLQDLTLVMNKIGNEGVMGLRLPQTLQSLGLGNNLIGDEGALGLSLPQNLSTLLLGSNHISTMGIQRIKYPQNLQWLDISNNQLNNTGIQGWKFPLNLKWLDLSHNQIDALGFQGCEFPINLQWLDLSYNPIGNAGVKDLLFPKKLQMLSLFSAEIGDIGAQGLNLPSNLQALFLGDNQLGNAGAQGLKLPQSLQTLYLYRNQIGDTGMEGLSLPLSLELLDLSYNNIGNVGVMALLKKIPNTNLNTINLNGNNYNSSVLNDDRVLQQQILLRRCRDKICHANTPLQDTSSLLQKANDVSQETNTFQTSAASRTYTPLLSTLLKKPLHSLQTLQSIAETAIKTVAQTVSQTVSQTANTYFTSLIDMATSQLRNALSHCPSYFPNIDSPVLHDWHPPGPIMLRQYDQFLVTNSNTTSLLISYAPMSAIGR